MKAVILEYILANEYNDKWTQYEREVDHPYRSLYYNNEIFAREDYSGAEYDFATGDSIKVYILEDYTDKYIGLAKRSGFTEVNVDKGKDFA